MLSCSFRTGTTTDNSTHGARGYRTLRFTWLEPVAAKSAKLSHRGGARA
jgi:hypothetical protein